MSTVRVPFDDLRPRPHALCRRVLPFVELSRAVGAAVQLDELRVVEKTVPKEQEIHIVLDNYATHKHEKVLAWIERKKRVFLHFIPTSASWANLVERFFGILTQEQIRRGVFTSVPHLEKCLREYLESYNENPRALVWTKSVGVERSYPKQLNHYFVKDTTLV